MPLAAAACNFARSSALCTDFLSENGLFVVQISPGLACNKRKAVLPFLAEIEFLLSGRLGSTPPVRAGATQCGAAGWIGTQV
jgi:hypothetical protein